MGSPPLLSAENVDRLLDLPAATTAITSGFTAPRPARPARRVVVPLDVAGNRATVLVPGTLPDIPAYTVEANAKFPAANPAINGIVCLHDRHLLALIDSGRLSAWRTGIAAAIATDTLARHDARQLTVIGAGTQNTTTVTALLTLRPAWAGINIVDPDARAAHRLADHLTDLLAEHRGDPAATSTVTTTVTAGAEATAEVVAGTDVVLAATWARTPVLADHDVSPGTHITSLGADEPGKTELPRELLARAYLVVDDRDLAATGGIASDPHQPARIDAELRDVLAHPARAGRHNDSQITVYAPVGEPWLDLALAWHLHQPHDSSH